jgi:hypothetical protein
MGVCVLGGGKVRGKGQGKGQTERAAGCGTRGGEAANGIDSGVGGRGRRVLGGARALREMVTTDGWRGRTVGSSQAPISVEVRTTRAASMRRGRRGTRFWSWSDSWRSYQALARSTGALACCPRIRGRRRASPCTLARKDEASNLFQQQPPRWATSWTGGEGQSGLSAM